MMEDKFNLAQDILLDKFVDDVYAAGVESQLELEEEEEKKKSCCF